MALNWCCCCVPLRTGALAIAILYLVVNVGVLLGFSGWFFADIVPQMKSLHDQDEHARSFSLFESTGFVAFVLVVTMCGLNITMDSLLVHGIRSNRRRLVLPWVIWYGIFTSLATLALLVAWIWLLVEYIDDAKHPYDGIGIQIAFLITIGCVAAISLPVMWYWYACVVSYYMAPSAHGVRPMETADKQDTDVTLLPPGRE